MANRRPLIMANGALRELPAGDNLTGGAPWVSITPPTDPANWPWWYDLKSGRLKVYVNDGDSSQWVDPFPLAPRGRQGIQGPTGPASWGLPTNWATATPYVSEAPSSTVHQGGETYVCLVSHTSGVFATDLAAGKWQKITAKPTVYLSVMDEFYRMVAEANVAMNSAANGTLWDKVTDKGGFVILALGGVIVGTAYRAGTSYTVPAGKTAVIVDMRFDLNSLNNFTFYKHRLLNVTTGVCNAGPNTNETGTTATSVFAGGAGNGQGFTLAMPIAPVSTTISLPVAVATAGQVIRAEVGGGNDANGRPTFGMYIVAIIDATTKLLDPIVR